MSSRITGVGVAFPENSFTQEEVGQLLSITNPTVQKLLKSPHIKTRSLYFAKAYDKTSGKLIALEKESPQTLHQRFLLGLQEIGVTAALDCITRSGTEPTDIDVVVGVTSSGLALPGFSAILAKQFKMRENVKRNDLVGMGCNAGMTGLQSLNMQLRELSNKEQRSVRGLLVCCEINSAIYVNDNTVGKGIVNSLFGDGAAALLLEADVNNNTIQDNNSQFPEIRLLDFESCTVTDHFEEMVYLVDPDAQQLNFRLSKQIPFIVGEKAPLVVREALARNNLAVDDVSHWIVHAGGAKVMEKFAENLSLTLSSDLRHTVSVLQDHGNLSSLSFIVSFDRFVKEFQQNREDRKFSAGDIVVFAAMGPGMTIEVGVGRIENKNMELGQNTFSSERQWTVTKEMITEPSKSTLADRKPFYLSVVSFFLHYLVVWVQVFCFVLMWSSVVPLIFGQDGWLSFDAKVKTLVITGITVFSLEFVSMPLLQRVYLLLSLGNLLPKLKSYIYLIEPSLRKIVKNKMKYQISA